MSDEEEKKPKKKATKQKNTKEAKKLRADRARARKKSFKLTVKQVEMIRSQQGKKSVRETAKWFKEKHHGIHRVSPTLVHRIWKGERHASTMNKVSIYDLINDEQLSEEEIEERLEGLDPRSVKFD